MRSPCILILSANSEGLGTWRPSPTLFQHRSRRCPVAVVEPAFPPQTNGPPWQGKATSPVPWGVVTATVNRFESSVDLFCGQPRKLAPGALKVPPPRVGIVNLAQVFNLLNTHRT